MCAPAVPLLWLEFVLLCFRVVTIEEPPPHSRTHTLLPPHLNPSNPPCTVLPHIFSPFPAHALKESEKDGFCIKCRCPGWVKRAAEAMAAYRQGVSLFSLGSPTCGRSWPTWVSQLFTAKKNLCGWMLLLKPLFSVSPHTHKRPGNAAELLVPHERFMVRLIQSRLVWGEKKGTKLLNDRKENEETGLTVDYTIYNCVKKRFLLFLNRTLCKCSLWFFHDSFKIIWSNRFLFNFFSFLHHHLQCCFISMRFCIHSCTAL